MAMEFLIYNGFRRYELCYVGTILFSLFFMCIQSQERLRRASDFMDGNEQVSVRLDLVVQEEYVTVSCHVKNPHPESRVFLACPLLNEPRFCFQECRPVCQSVGSFCSEKTVSLLSSAQCRKTSQEIDNLLIVSYRVDSSNVENAGRWWCLHAGKKSSSVVVEPYVKKTTVSTTTITSTPTSSAPTKEVIITKPIPSNSSNVISSSSTRSIPSLPNQKDGQQGSSSDKSKNSEAVLKARLYENVTSPELVIAIIVLLFVSLVLNIAFCARCLLVRRFIVLEKEGHSASPHLLNCLCIGSHHYATYKRSQYATTSGNVGNSHLNSKYSSPSQQNPSNGKANSMSASLSQLPTLRYLNMSEALELSSNATANALIYEDPNQFVHTLPPQGIVKGRRHLDAQASYQNSALSGSVGGGSSGGGRRMSSSRSFSSTPPGSNNTQQTMLIPAALYTDPQCRTVFALPLTHYNSTGVLYNSSSQLCAAQTIPVSMYDEVSHAKRVNQMPSSLSTGNATHSVNYPPPLNSSKPHSSAIPQQMYIKHGHVNRPMWEDDPRHQNSNVPSHLHGNNATRPTVLSASRNSINETQSGDAKISSPSWRSDATGCEDDPDETTATPPLMFSVISTNLPTTSELPIQNDFERTSRLQLSRTLLSEADNLLKEAGSLLI